MRYLILIILFISLRAFSQPVSDAAKKYYDRGQAALELAQNHADTLSALAEFKEALRLAPNWPDIHLALGQFQEQTGDLLEAINSYKRYLELAPAASNVEAIKSLINKLEYKLDKIAQNEQVIKLLTDWNTNGSKVDFIRTGDPDHGIYRLKNFIQVDGKLQAYIYSDVVRNNSNYGISFDQTVPVEFNGSVLQFSYSSFFCPGSPQMKYCEEKVTVVAELISKSPLKFKVKETWTDVRQIHETTYKNAVWEFIDKSASEPIQPISSENVGSNSIDPVQSMEGAEFVLTKKMYSEKDDLEAAVQQEFGESYRMADWNDVAAYCQMYSVATFLKMVSLQNGDTQDPLVTFNGQHFWKGWEGQGTNRHFFISRFDDQQPRAKDNGSYLAHENIENNKLTLASWSKLNAHILCVKKSNK